MHCSIVVKKNMDQERPDNNNINNNNQDKFQSSLRRGKQPEVQMPAAHQHNNHQGPPPPPQLQKCPRCDSANTKFCYYNNYSLSQPRYFCKACRRYWTQGGTLRNVPVGGGCRKSKRPKPSPGETSRAQSSSVAALASQNLTGGFIPGGGGGGQGFRAMPPVMPPSMGNSFYTGGSFLSSLAAMHSLPAGINQRATTLNLGGGGGGNNSQYDANNMAVFRAPPPLPPQQYFQAQNEFFPSAMTMPPRPLGSWTQTFINRGGAASSSATNPSFWGGAATAGDNDNQAGGSSFNPNHWPDNHPGFDPSQ
ncbi:hypothetical protein ABFX02_13G105500 [Erythranthe guttata]